MFGVTVSLWYAAGLWGGSISTWWDMPESFDISQPGPDNPQAVLGDIHVDVQPSMRPDSSAVLAHALLWYPGLTAGREASLRLDTPLFVLSQPVDSTQTSCPAAELHQQGAGIRWRLQLFPPTDQCAHLVIPAQAKGVTRI